MGSYMSTGIYSICDFYEILYTTNLNRLILKFIPNKLQY